MSRLSLGVVLAFSLAASLAPAQAPPVPPSSRLLGEQGGLVFGLAVSPDGKLLASSGFDGTVKLWDLPGNREVAVIKAPKQMYAVAFNKDGTILATGSDDQVIRTYDPKDIKDGKPIKELRGHGGIIDSLAFAPEGNLLASGSQDKSVRLWDAKEGKELKNLGSHKEAVYSVAFSPKGDLLASAGNDGVIKIWDVKGQKELKTLLLPIEVKEERKEEKKEMKKEEKKEEKKEAKKEEKKKDEKELRDAITGVAFSPDGSQLLSVGFDHQLHFWNVNEGKVVKSIAETKDDQFGDLFGISISRDGKRVAVAGYGGTLHVFDLDSGKEVFKDHLKGWITYAVAFAPDGQALITANEKRGGTGAILVTPLKK